MHKVKVALIGCGGFGELWWDIIKDHHIVALIDVNRDALHKAKNFFGVEEHRCYSPNELWEKSGAEFIIDCSPFPYHFDNAKRAIENNIHIITSKPMCSNPKEALKLLELTQTHSARAFVAHQKRYYPVFKALREVLDKGTIGKIENVKVEMHLSGLGWMPGHQWRSTMDEPTLFEAAIHHLDLFNYIFQSPISEVFCHSWNPSWSPFQGNSSLLSLIKTDSNISIRYEATFAPREKEKFVAFDSGWVIEGTKAVAKIQNGNVYIDGELVSDPEIKSPPLEVLNKEVWGEILTCVQNDLEHELSYSNNINSLLPLFACQESIKEKKWVNMQEFKQRMEAGVYAGK